MNPLRRASHRLLFGPYGNLASEHAWYLDATCEVSYAAVRSIGFWGFCAIPCPWHQLLQTVAAFFSRTASVPIHAGEHTESGSIKLL